MGPPARNPAASRPTPASSAAPGTRGVVLALGSNLGDRLANLQRGIDVLCAEPGLASTVVSPVYETVPVGGPEQGDFLNAVLVATSSLPARSILDRCRAAEAALHRLRDVACGPRTLDVDLIVCGAEVSADPELTLPHPRAHERAFVLAPWHDLEPAAVLPGRGPIADLLTAVGLAGVRRLRDARLRGCDRADGASPVPRARRAVARR